MIAVSPFEMEIILNIIKKHTPNYDVLAFGSRYKWTNTETSDLDLALIGEDKIGYSVISKIKEDFMESDLPFKVDVIDYNAISESFKKIIDAGNERIYKGKRERLGLRCKLGDVCDIKHGFAFKGEYFCDTPTEYLLVTPGNFAIGGGFQFGKPKNYNGPIPKDYMLNEGDLIVTMTDLSKQGDTLGYSAFIPEDNRYLHNQRIGLVTINSDNVLSEYVYWIMRTRDYQKYIVNHASGSTVKHTAPKTILSYEIELPDLDTQRTVADTLSSFDDKIANNTAINHNLEQMARAVWAERFGNREPNCKLGDWFPVITGKKDANVAKGGIYPFFSCSQNILYTDNYSFDANAILLAGNGDFNVKVYSGKFEAYQRTYVLIPNEQKHLGFLYYAIKHCLSEITSGFRGSVIRFITKGSIENFELFMPCDDETFGLFNGFVEQIAHNNAENARLAELRDTLLPRLMSGEVFVADLTAK
ncbi:MAG: restriction endonuclease subunit S [Oscillospiraceae bacterium]|nr:restriction endonuclease subunit S [Oscillospiraceae bacterium]